LRNITDICYAVSGRLQVRHVLIFSGTRVECCVMRCRRDVRDVREGFKIQFGELCGCEREDYCIGLSRLVCYEDI